MVAQQECRDVEPNRLTAAQTAAKAFVPGRLRTSISACFLRRDGIARAACRRNRDDLLAPSSGSRQRGTATGSGSMSRSDAVPMRGSTSRRCIKAMSPNGARGRPLEARPRRKRKLSARRAFPTHRRDHPLSDGRGQGSRSARRARMAADRGRSRLHGRLRHRAGRCHRI